MGSGAFLKLTLPIVSLRILNYGNAKQVHATPTTAVEHFPIPPDAVKHSRVPSVGAEGSNIPVTVIVPTTVRAVVGFVVPMPTLPPPFKDITIT